MESLEFIQLFQVVIGQVQAGGACHSPNPVELTLIVALIGGIGVFSVASGIAIVSMANTIVALLISGASIGAVVAAVSGNAAATGGSGGDKRPKKQIPKELDRFCRRAKYRA